MSDRQDILRRIIQNDIGRMGAGYQPNLSVNPSYREDREDRFPGDQPMPTGLAQAPQSPRPPSTADAGGQFMRDMEGLLGSNRSLTGREPPTPSPARAPQDAPPMPQDIGTQYPHPFQHSIDRANANPNYLSSAADGSNPAILNRVGEVARGAADRVRFPHGPDSEFMQNLDRTDPERAALLRAQMPDRPGSAEAGMPNIDPSVPPMAGLPDGSQAMQGRLPQNPDVMFGGMDAGIAGPPQAPATPAERAQAGLQAAMQGQPRDVDPMSPEQFDPETGTRTEDARKLGLLERMFGEKGSDEYRQAGKALMMAGAAIMSTNGDLGTALGNGIQAGLMTYDDAMQALRDEEKEARQMGMTEEAHELNMELKRLQLQRARQGPVKAGAAETGLTDVQKAVITAGEILTLFPDTSPEDAKGFALRKHVSAYRPEDRDPFGLGQ